MKLVKLAPVATLALLGLAGCGGPEGKYTLDKDATKAAIDSGSDAKDAKEFGKAILEAMDMTIEIKSGGKFDATSSIEMEKGKKEEKTESGDWTKEGDKLTLKGAKDPMTCTIEGSKLLCASGEKKGSFVFKKS